MDNNPDGGMSADLLGLEDKISKIRSQINSKLENQKQLAIILSAVEENIEEQHNEKSPITYFVSFLSLLEQSVKEDEIADVGLATTSAYFLDIFVPFTPASLLKSKFGEILTKLAPCLTHPKAEAPLIRSTIGVLESLLLVQEHQQWSSNSNISPKRALLGLLELSFDIRPKVRKRAQEAIKNILMNPPASPSPYHIASPLIGEISLNKLKSLMEESRATKKSAQKEINSQLIHCLQLVTVITSTNSWPTSQVENLCDVLLEISKASDQFLISSTFQAFEGLFKSMTNEIDIERFNRVLDIIFDLKPSLNDTYLAATWLAIIAKGLESFSILSPEACFKKLVVIIPIVAGFLASESKDITTSSSQCLIAIISQTIPDNLLLFQTPQNGISDEVAEFFDDFVPFISQLIEKELFSIKYQHSTKEILEFVTACVLKFRTRGSSDFFKILITVGDWRTNESNSFPYNKEVEDLISAYIKALGPQFVLGYLPLNLESSDQPGRAWLLPLLRDNVSNAKLQFYKTNVLPSVEFFDAKIKESNKKDTVHNKIFQTIIDQIWSLLPRFADLPVDLRDAFDDKFAAQLSELMYSNVELRTPICNALRVLVESNLKYIESEERDLFVEQEFPVSEAQKNIEYLASKASNVLSVLFNVFSSTLPDSRGFVLETIDVFLRIIPKPDLEVTFNKVCGLLKQAMDDEASSNAKPKKDEPALSVTMMDLVVAMSKYVPEPCHNALMSIFSSTVSMTNSSLMQKRSYRIISRLLETDEGKATVVRFIKEIQDVMVQTTESTVNSARAPRLTTILFIVELLPQSDLYFVPSILQEIIMSTKDVNERSRELSYQILIKMGKIMGAGGMVENSKVPGFAPDAPSSEASLNEYFTMVSAGLAAQSPHMISATITAISCLVFEFKNDLPVEVLMEISSTVELFLTHNSREIAKAAIGFVKVEVLSLPEDLVRNNLSELLSKLMRWSHEHKGHFKSKVKHILERLIRKFGVELVEQAIPEEDKKLVANIKKTRARAKRRGEGEDEDASKGTEKKFVSAYEEALYDSEVSDDEAEEDEKPTKGKKKSNQFILDTGDEPLNLLDRQSLAHISSSKPKKFDKKELTNIISEFKTANGKLVINDKDEDPLAGKGSGVDAYLDAVKQAPVRGQRNKLKFKKSKEEDNWSDDEDSQPAAKKAYKGSNKVMKPRQKFKARKKF
ncbi:putative ribosome export protein [Suhomyces tanzawaensis NRRL Y-17324]|uniref:Putative ribosome export protein n=1 Tax=Suhomyces tanzawaensis NRRL Y-17324 TaxID=984487 RepID=A0A1E4SRH8_9ASCO|nr:putative ribosome export protein [Suhomyces tanzawaensis NRRL Y-17324]ODV82105.1 putative ribosome export protein [Suhomyces tanzawaensis NRRL Y-17324]